MARARNSNQKKSNNGANVGYEAELWQMADALRGSMDAAGQLFYSTQIPTCLWFLTRNL